MVLIIIFFSFRFLLDLSDLFKNRTTIRKSVSYHEDITPKWVKSRAVWKSHCMRLEVLQRLLPVPGRENGTIQIMLITKRHKQTSTLQRSKYIVLFRVASTNQPTHLSFLESVCWRPPSTSIRHCSKMRRTQIFRWWRWERSGTYTKSTCVKVPTSTACSMDRGGKPFKTLFQLKSWTRKSL